MYRQVDEGFGDEGRKSQVKTEAGFADARDQAAGAGRAQVDAELITRRNIFLAPDDMRTSDAGNNPLASLEGAGPDLMLIGTVVQDNGSSVDDGNAGGGSRAIIYLVEEEKQILVKVGDVVNGASVKQILPGKTLISRKGRNETLDVAAASELRRARKRGEQAAIQAPAKSNNTTDPGPGKNGQAADKVPEEDESQPLLVDPSQLGKNTDGMIIKGRISK